MDAKAIRNERTLVLLKPDAVQRGLIGEIIKRFESAGLKIVALKLVQPGRDFIAGHYSGSDDWIRGMGQKTLDSFREFGMDVKAELGTDDPYQIGQTVRGWLIEYVASSPVVAMVIEGVHAVSAVRALIGFTIPARAAKGTIRGDFSVDSNTLSTLEKRSTKNLIHASGELDEAAREIAYWFKPEEVLSYTQADEAVMF